MTTSLAIATAAIFIWLGMVLAISFLEAPLKFRAPGLDLRTGLAIGRLVFRALNIAETALAIVAVVAVLTGGAARTPVIIATAILAVQVLGVRPALTKRTIQVLSGSDAPRSHAHFVYIGLEVLKVVALVWSGVVLLAG